MHSSESLDDITFEVLEAQRAADAEVDAIEAKVSEELRNEVIDDALAPIPKLLQLSQDKLIKKTQDLKEKGNQLDLLLLKAESYSHFIKQNQDRCKEAYLQSSKKVRTSPVKKSPNKAKPGDVKPPNQLDIDTDNFTGISQPPNLKGGSLMTHQLEALQWLLSLWENGLSGILADEMGLGKTIEVIALFAQLRHCNTSGPFIVVGPLATITNWMKEFRKWLPDVSVLLYHGSKEERAELRDTHMQRSKQNIKEFPILITSFEIAMIDRMFLEQYEWKFMVLDEGHRIKNRNCKLVKELKSIPCVTRLLLTGTPIQNTLEELWSLLNFVNPTIFDDLEVFQSWFGFRNIGKDTQIEDIIGDEQKGRVVSKLHEILRPFLLRRLKRDVFGENALPPKKEVVIYCNMSSLQQQYYDLISQHKLRDTLVSLGIEGAAELRDLNPLMQYRKVCNHPFLFGEPVDTASGQYLGEAYPELLIMASGKFKLLDRMLPILHEQGHKVLIFSQMTALLDILQDYCALRNYKSCRFDGSTKLVDRQKSIDAFNDASQGYFIFLISTRAGGLGINLHGADTVILFDSDWNPTQDMQAQDRCHRLGQKRSVMVYRLLTVGSIEITMMERQISKKKLERLAIQGGDFKKAGERSGSNLTLTHLRTLLEDDVNLLKRGASSTLFNSDSTNDITEEELMLIMDRDKLFASLAEAEASGSMENSSPTASSKKRSISGSSTPVNSNPTSRNCSPTCASPGTIPLEGRMYDILSLEQYVFASVA